MSNLKNLTVAELLELIIDASRGDLNRKVKVISYVGDEDKDDYREHEITDVHALYIDEQLAFEIQRPDTWT